MVDLNIELPNGFMDEEVRCGYTVTLEMKKVWAVELDLLNEFMRVCEKYQLKYFACGGTLLGAVRHQGFIPWDDDIDVVMFREDYEKLKGLGQKVFKEGYFLQSTYTDKIVRQHMQLRKDGTTAFVREDYKKKYHRGVFIDIFVYDEVPSDKDEFSAFRKKLSDYYHKITGAVVEPYFCRIRGARGLFGIGRAHVNHLLLLVTEGGEKKAFRKYEEMVGSYNGRGTGLVANISFLCDKRKVHIYKTESFTQTVMLPFEHLKVACPVGYAENLRSQYGNYMEYVMGGCMHGGLFVDVDRSYEEYRNIKFDKFCKLFD